MEISKTAAEYYQLAEETDDMQEAFRALMQGFLVDNAYHQLYQLTAQLLRSVSANEEAVLFEQAAADFQSYAPFFELGYHFAEVHNWALAETFLQRAHQLQPKEVGVIYEYSFVMMHNFQFEAARKLMESIEISQDFWLAYRYFYCVILLNYQPKLEEAIVFLREIRQQIYQIEQPSEEDKYALHKLNELQQILQRLQMVGNPREHIRDWHFIQYGSAILSFMEEVHLENPEKQSKEVAAGRFVGVYLNEYEVMKTVQRLCKLLIANEVTPSCVLFLPDKSSEIIGHLVAGCLKIEAIELTEKNSATEKALIVAANAEDLSKWAGLNEFQQEQRLFAFHLDWTKQPFIVTEVVGVLAQYVYFPWDAGAPYLKEGAETWEEKEADERDAETIAKEISEEKVTDEADFQPHLDFYEQHKKSLLFSVKKGARPTFVRESPMRGAHF